VGGGIFDEPLGDEWDTTAEGPGQRPMEVDRNRYYETGRLNVGVGQDGMPVMGGEKPMGPDEGWSEKNLVCAAGADLSDGTPGRPVCEHFVALIVPADGAARGFDEMRQIRRFCTKLATAAELFEITGNVYACGARSPRDPQSYDLLRSFEAKQKKIAQDSAEKHGELDF
jgi:hypothetical protein